MEYLRVDSADTTHTMIFDFSGALGAKRRDILIVLCLQIILVVLFILFASYDSKYEKEIYPSKFI